MNKSRQYLKKLNHRQRIELAYDAGITEKYLMKIAANQRTPTIQVMCALELASNGRVKVKHFSDEIKRGMK